MSKKWGGQVDKPVEIDPRAMIEQEKQLRGENTAKAIQQLLTANRCQIRVTALVLRLDGGVEPQIQIVALD